MNKKKQAIVFAILSFVPVVISVLFFYIQRGPNSDIGRAINVFTILGLVGIVFVVTAFFKNRQVPVLITGLLGFVANGCVLAVAFLLMLAQGISEP